MEPKEIELGGDRRALIHDKNVYIREEPDVDGAFHHGMKIPYEELELLLEEGYRPFYADEE